MNLIFDGISSSYFLVFIVLLGAGCMALSWWTYRHVTTAGPASRAVLIGLRGAVFLLLLLLLLNPIFVFQQQQTLPSELGVVLDHSESATVEKPEYDGLASYRQVLDQLDDLQQRPGLELNIFAFDRTFFSADPDTLDFDGPATDIQHALTSFAERREDEQALILVTDGIYNRGLDPSHRASRFDVPIFTIGIGDTTRQSDVAVQNVNHNATAYTHSHTPVSASIRITGFPGRPIPVQLRRQGEVLQEQTIQTEREQAVQEVRFELELTEEGLQQYEIHVPEQEGEWTTENNSRLFEIDVRDDRIRVMLLSFDIHPDVRALRSILRRDRQIDLATRTWISGQEFVEGELPREPDTLDLFILQGFPGNRMPGALTEQVASMTRDRARLHIAGPDMSYGQLSSLYQGVLPISYDSSPPTSSQVHPAVHEQETNHPILEDLHEIPQQAPGLQGPVTGIGDAAGSERLLQAMDRGSVTDTPLLTVRSIGNYRVAALNAHDFFRWFLSDDDAVREYLIRLIDQTVKWTSTTPDDELLRVTPARQPFQETEPVVLNAFLQDESGVGEEQASIEVKITGEPLDDPRSYTMRHRNLGQYQLDMGPLPAGMYRFEAEAETNGRHMDTHTGDFTIGGSNLEMVDTRRNDDLLRYIAESSGGTFLTHSRSGVLSELLEEHELTGARTETTERQVMAYQHPLWFILVLVLLTTEWILRRFYALP